MTVVRTATEATSAIVQLLERSSSAGSELECSLLERALLAPLRDLLGRRSKELRGWLVDLGFRLGGGAAGACPPELPVIIEALHAGSLIIDDIEDGSTERRGAPALHRVYGMPVALNAGNWLYFWPLVLLSRTALPDAVRLRAHERIAASLLRCHEGQALDLSVRVWELPQSEVPAVVRAITERKTAGLVALATMLGAIAAGADAERVDAIGHFGREVGIALQMFDDLSGVLVERRRHKAIEDLQHARATWVWAWLSQTVDGEAYRALVDEIRSRRAITDGYVERLRAHLDDDGLRHARAQLECALSAVRAAGADDLRAHEVASQLASLERSYVPG